jgi:hypothetical protein
MNGGRLGLLNVRLNGRFISLPGHLKRPRFDTLNDSRHPNTKELPFGAADGEWRVAFAFDTKRKAILLVAGTNQESAEQFYRELNLRRMTVLTSIESG